tara:strand:- start:1508 stop:1666 length:159 start_codon:yes stop_codon:yes gene_type:complete
LIEPTIGHISEGLLTPEEACFIFSASALLLFAKTSKLKNIPANEFAQELVKI